MRYKPPKQPNTGCPAWILAGVRAVKEGAIKRQIEPLTQPKETLEIPNPPDG